MMRRRISGGSAAVAGGFPRLADVRHIVADPAKASRVLGFAAQAAFEVGIREFATAAGGELGESRGS